MAQAPRTALGSARGHGAQVPRGPGEHRDRIVAEHVVEHPGTRPTRWWEFSAPEPVDDDQRGAIVLRQKWSRGQVEARFANLQPCLVGMEASVGAHHLSR